MPVYRRSPTRTSREPVASVQRRKVRHNNVPQGFKQGLPGFSQLLEIPAVTVDPQNGRLILDRENKGNRA